ncbi:hypothetical protein DPMN_063299 [Dreissena polymorpha]|uniref:HAT C-terminal dimerisation domain-containing protein n=1 Tax=Dreissena polymorpha TaxID=45954 RepID=A0A9D4CAQ6_DREPO|nr:hypothetical protein DPMN_063299 [Dreissena polymorpha]
MAWGMLLMADEELSNISLLIDLVLSLPPTSVSCETSFSHMKLVKTSSRLRMNQATLHSLMTVKLCSPDIKEFNPESAVEKWLVLRLSCKFHS